MFSRGAELVRATYEAGIYATYVGADDSYPGYRGAVGEPTGRGNEDKREYFTWRKPENTTQVARTDFNHITDYRATDDEVSAVVCSYYLFPNDRGNASLEPLGTAANVELTKSTSDSSGPAGLPDRDSTASGEARERTPTWNVFGSWKIRRISYVRTFDDQPAPNGCATWWQKQCPSFTVKPPLNVLAAPPDFAAPTQPVAVQYPEWIGPDKTE